MIRRTTTLAVAAALLVPTVASAKRGGARHDRGHVAIVNQLDEPLQVVVDARTVGTVAPHDRTRFRAPEGRHRVELQDLAGNVVLRQRVEVEAGERDRVIASGAPAVLRLDNDSGAAALFEAVDRSGARHVVSLAPGASTRLQVTPGEVALTATHTWSGARFERTLAAQLIEPGEVDALSLEPLGEAMVKVDNDAPWPIRLVSDDDALGTVAPDSVGFVMVPVGRTPIRIESRGAVVGSREVVVDPARGGQLRIRDTSATLAVTNTTPVWGRLTVDGIPGGWVEPGETVELVVPAGRRSVQLANGRGEVLQERDLRLDEGEVTPFHFRYHRGLTESEEGATAWEVEDASPERHRDGKHRHGRHR